MVGMERVAVHRDRVVAGRQPVEVGQRRSLRVGHRDQAHRRADAADQRVDVPGLSGQRAVHGVADGRSDGRAQRCAQRPRVIVDDVEIAGARIAGERMVQVGHRQPDPHAGRLVVAGHQPRLGLRIAGREQRHVVPLLDQAVGQDRHHPLDAAVTRGRHREPGRGDDADLHHPRLLRPPTARLTHVTSPSRRTSQQTPPNYWSQTPVVPACTDCDRIVAPRSRG